MYFPDDMNFQYFFFSTYPGFFLQALPIALITGGIYTACQIRRDRRRSTDKIILSALFVCYITGLLCLTLLNSVIGDIYYFLFYHAPSGRSHTWFTFEYDLIPDFFHNFGSENLGNIVMFLPFGILYPLFKQNSTWMRTLIAGFVTTLGIELVQPVFGRSFDINDIILNSIGVAVSTAVFYTMKMVLGYGRGTNRRKSNHGRKI